MSKNRKDTLDEVFQIDGMTCAGCAQRIEDALNALDGVTSAKISDRLGTGRVAYRPDVIGREAIVRAIEQAGYAVNRPAGSGDTGKIRSAAGALLIVAAAYMVLRHTGLLNLFSAFPQAEAGMGYGMLFLIGLLTSVHCVAMCGGINLSQCIPAGAEAPGGLRTLRPGLLYNLGRVVSYTLVGAVAGLIGSAVGFSGTAKGIIQLAAGVFMVIMGINMLGIFPWMRRFSLHLPRFFTGKIRSGGQSRGPLVVGLLNGLMPCGPLQAMQLYALSLGSAWGGALSMLLFSLGTVPLMFGLGALSSFLSRRFTGRMMAAGAVLVVVMGVSMFQSGMALSGISPVSGSAAAAVAEPEANGVQVVHTSLAPRRYEPITVAAGTPVEWTVTAEPGAINNCNNRMIVREYGIEKTLSAGENLIEFTPDRSGVFSYSCWMGMIRSTITVTERDGTVADTTVEDGAYADENPYFSQPVLIPTDYSIPADSIAVAQTDGLSQYVEIDMTDERFSPAIIVVQYGLETEWIIHNGSRDVAALVFPDYNMRLTVVDGDNLVYLIPLFDFDFYAENGFFFGYVKVVEDLNAFDEEAVLQEAEAHVAYIVDYASAA